MDLDAIDSDIADADLAVALVTAAGSLAAKMRAAGVTGTAKTSVSDVVTEADHAAEALVFSALRRLRPADGVIGEEGTNLPSSTGRTWVIDPVDGTYNFLSGLHYWCSAIAVRDDATEEPTIGAVHHPVSGDTWVGGSSLPTTLNGTRLSPLTDAPLAQISVASYLHPALFTDRDLLEPFLAMVGGAATQRVLGSGSMDLSGVASGRLGCWTQQSVPSWDWLPGQALVAGAGGHTAVIEHRGHRWCLAGPPTAVTELADRLRNS